MEIVILLGLMLVNGMFAMTELAVVSARRAKLQRMADAGDARARAALELAREPNRFLSTVQVGITLVGIFAGAFGGVTLAEEIAQAARAVPMLEPYARPIGMAVVVLGITYLSLVIGELVPKRLALMHPESIARVMARPMQLLSRLASPVVRLLGGSTEIVLRLLGVKAATQPRVTEEEVRMLLEEGVQEGVFFKSESEMVDRVMALDRLPVREIMTPRPKIIFLNRTDSHESIWHKIVVSGHSSFPVYEGNRDNVVGMVTVKAVYAHLAAGLAISLPDLMTATQVVPATQPVSRLLEVFRTTGRHVAMVADEFGDMVGLVTLVDVLEAIAGEFPNQEERLRPHVVRRGDGTWLVDGLMELEELAKHLPGLRFPGQAGRGYETLAGLVVSMLSRVPKEGDILEWGGFRFEVIDMDRHRVDKLLVSPRAAGPSADPRDKVQDAGGTEG